METVPTLAIDRNRLKTMMNLRGIPTYAVLSAATGIHQNSLVRMLHSLGFNTKSLVKLAVALQCNPIDLIVTTGFVDFSLGAPGQPVAEPIDEPEADDDQDEAENNTEPGGPFDPDQDDESEDEGELVSA